MASSLAPTENRGLHDDFFSPDPATAEIVAVGIATTGAILMGRRTYDTGAQQGRWADDPTSGGGSKGCRFIQDSPPPRC
jgi:hypothetical protein